MTTKEIGPWPLGIDMLSSDERMPTDRNSRIVAARDSVNGDFSREGMWRTRPGLLRLLSEIGLHSAWSAPDGRAYGVARGNELVSVTIGQTAAALETLHVMPSAAPVSFDVLNDEIVFTSRDFIGVIGTDQQVRPLAVPDAALPAVAATPAGGLPPGRYGIAIAFVNARGEEGGLSPAATIDVPISGGIRLTLPPAPAGVAIARIYRTGTNGKQLYRAADAPLSMGTYLLGNGQLGRAADTMFLRAMQPGDIVRAWQHGRLLVARGRVLWFSQPMRYGLTSPRHGFIQFPRQIAFVEGVAGGIYVGQTGDTVLFLRGTRPGEFEQVRTGGDAPVPRSSIKAPNDLFSPDLQLAGECAVWLAENGYVIGRADGQLVEPQAQRIRLPATAPGQTAVVDRRLVTIITTA